MSTPSKSGFPVEAPRYQEGHLHWYGCDLQDVADLFDTPAHVGCAEAVSDALRAFRAPFLAADLPLEVCYSVKTNPLPAFLEALRREGVGFEVCSAHELDLVDRLGVEGGRIIATGLRDGFSFALRAGELCVGMLTVATAGQLQTIIKERGEPPPRFPLALTICPQLRRGRWDLTLNTGARGAAIGFRPGTAELNEAMSAIAAHQQLDLVGLHMHIGSGIRCAAPYRKAIKTLERVIHTASGMGHSIRIVDIGGGYGLTSAPVLGPWKIVSTLLGPKTATSEARAHDTILVEVADALSRLFSRLERLGIRPEVLVTEPGRILSGPCQLLLLTVLEVIDRGRHGRFLLCDGGSMAISPMLMTEAHRVMTLREPGGQYLHYRVLGSMPTALDRVCAGVLLPEMHPGDQIAVLDTGAYFVSMNNTFSGPRPPVVWIEEGEARLARRRETEMEVFSRDLLPQGKGADGENTP